MCAFVKFRMFGKVSTLFCYYYDGFLVVGAYFFVFLSLWLARCDAVKHRFLRNGSINLPIGRIFLGP